MPKKSCCCGCQSANCTSAVLDCQSIGLRPFWADVGINFQPATCDKISAGQLYCENANCGTWGTHICGGCIPCDEYGTAPGANGRTCPCPNDTQCNLPSGREVPYINCTLGNPEVETRSCLYGHADFWYFTFKETGNDPCDVPTESLCPWLGSVSCYFDLVRVPAGFFEVECGSIGGLRERIKVDEITQCWQWPQPYPPPVRPLPWPTSGLRYGQPWDCELSPPPCPGLSNCMCPCVGGIFPTWLITQYNNSPINPTTGLPTCNDHSLYAQILWVVPCASGQNFGGILSCGDQCVCEGDEYAYVAVQYYGVAPKNAPSTYGSIDFAFVDPNDPTSVFNACYPLVGDPATTPLGTDCTAFGEAGGMYTCYDTCCECTYNTTIIFRKKRTNMAQSDKCILPEGEYDVAGYGPCGDLQLFACDDQLCASKDKCTGSDDQWREELRKIGITAIKFSVSY